MNPSPTTKEVRLSVGSWTGIDTVFGCIYYEGYCAYHMISHKKMMCVCARVGNMCTIIRIACMNMSVLLLMLLFLTYQDYEMVQGSARLLVLPSV